VNTSRRNLQLRWKKCNLCSRRALKSKPPTRSWLINKLSRTWLLWCALHSSRTRWWWVHHLWSRIIQLIRLIRRNSVDARLNSVINSSTRHIILWLTPHWKFSRQSVLPAQRKVRLSCLILINMSRRRHSGNSFSNKSTHRSSSIRIWLKSNSLPIFSRNSHTQLDRVTCLSLWDSLRTQLCSCPQVVSNLWSQIHLQVLSIRIVKRHDDTKVYRIKQSVLNISKSKASKAFKIPISKSSSKNSKRPNWCVSNRFHPSLCKANLYSSRCHRKKISHRPTGTLRLRRLWSRRENWSHSTTNRQLKREMRRHSWPPRIKLTAIFSSHCRWTSNRSRICRVLSLQQTRCRKC